MLLLLYEWNASLHAELVGPMQTFAGCWAVAAAPTILDLVLVRLTCPLGVALQVRMRALLPIVFLECLGVCVLLGVYSSWSHALVRASCILVTASLSGTLVEQASRRLFLATVHRRAAAIGRQRPQSCPPRTKDPTSAPQQRRHSDGPVAVKERLAERLRRRSQPVPST